MNKSDIRKVIGESILADGMSPVIDLEKSHGSWLVDKVTGKEYLDLFSMFASLSVGYNHPYVLEQSERLKVAAISVYAMTSSASNINTKSIKRIIRKSSSHIPNSMKTKSQ